MFLSQVQRQTKHRLCYKALGKAGPKGISAWEDGTQQWLLYREGIAWAFSKVSCRYPHQLNLPALVAPLPSASGLLLCHKHWAQFFQPNTEETQIHALEQGFHPQHSHNCITLCNRWCRREPGGWSTVLCRLSPHPFKCQELSLAQVSGQQRAQQDYAAQRSRWKHEQLGLEMRNKLMNKEFILSIKHPSRGVIPAWGRFKAN